MDKKLLLPRERRTALLLPVLPLLQQVRGAVPLRGAALPEAKRFPSHPTRGAEAVQRAAVLPPLPRVLLPPLPALLRARPLVLPLRLLLRLALHHHRPPRACPEAAYWQ